jgi:acetylornithine/N-succinyldiaminopimelate aminotransferase
MSQASSLIPNYARLPVALTHGEGAWLWDAQGKRYLDALAGIAVNTLGHAHPSLVAALQDQVTKLIHTSNYYQVPLQEQLAKELVALSGLSQAFFCSSGLEANEAALKLARKWGQDRGVARPQILVYERAFHGRSLATLWASGNEKIQKGFGPAWPDFVRIPFDDEAALHAASQAHPDIVAVMIEPIQGEGGIHSVHSPYLAQLRQVCDAQGWLLIFDEVQCGMGRTGRWFAHQWGLVKPDAMTLAKGLGSGVPVGALLIGPRAEGIFGPGNHGSTFGGNPLAMRAGLATLAAMREENLLENAIQVGAALKQALESQLGSHAGVVAIRGQGLMLGIELDRPCSDLALRCAQIHPTGLLVSVTAERVIRLLPPLILTHSQALEIVALLAPLVIAFLEEDSPSPV